MQASKLNTVSVTDVGAKNPSTIITAGKQPMRVVVRNRGTNELFLAHSAAELALTVPTSGTFSIDPGDEEVFVLAPKQSLFAAGAGAGGRICYAASEAIPTTFMES